MGFMDRFLVNGSTQKSSQINQASKGIAYMMWSCLCDNDSCDKCKELDGTCWIPGLANINEPPLSSCSSREGCRCMGVSVSNAESGANDVAAFIRVSGGKVTSKQLTEYHDAKVAPLREKRERQRVAAAKALEAYKIEKENPKEAIALYQECIRIHRELAEISGDQWSWQDLPSLYNRLTLVLERLGQHKEALDNISVFDTLPCHDQGVKSDRDAIEKRKTRLTQKLGC